MTDGETGKGDVRPRPQDGSTVVNAISGGVQHGIVVQGRDFTGLAIPGDFRTDAYLRAGITTVTAGDLSLRPRSLADGVPAPGTAALSASIIYGWALGSAEGGASWLAAPDGSAGENGKCPCSRAEERLLHVLGGFLDGDWEDRAWEPGHPQHEDYHDALQAARDRVGAIEVFSGSLGGSEALVLGIEVFSSCQAVTPVDMARLARANGSPAGRRRLHEAAGALGLTLPAEPRLLLLLSDG